MLRKTIVTIAVAAMLGGTMLIPTDASARGGRGGHGHGGFHGSFRGGHVARFYSIAPAYASCWAYVPGRWGPVKIWVC